MVIDLHGRPPETSHGAIEITITNDNGPEEMAVGGIPIETKEGTALVQMITKIKNIETMAVITKTLTVVIRVIVIATTVSTSTPTIIETTQIIDLTFPNANM